MAKKKTSAPPKDIDILIGKNLKRLRKKLDISQKQVGEAMGIERQRVSGIENGHIPMGKELMERFCKAFNVEPYEFYINEKTPIITDKREHFHLQKYRRVEELGMVEELDDMTDFLINRALEKKPSKKK
ncbi:MAG: helix-turn-helix transcriptional regulator [Nitrospirota bacterium]